jgi:hypothetical protein
MIKFFRKIRQSLLTQNKLSRYLLYAIGEIFLVVIGILLALNINNKNQQKLNEDKIAKILKEIQQDLVSDVMQSKRILDRFIDSDSIRDLILNDKYTYEDYKTKKAERLPFWYVDYVINTNGYDNLMRNIDNVPDKFEPLIKDLKELYVKKKSNIDVYNKRIRETVYKNIDHVWKNYDWNRDWQMGIQTDEAYNYYLNSSEYKNMVLLYMNDRSNTINSTQSYSLKAIETYNKIKEHTKSMDSIPKVMTLESEDTTFLNSIVGKYKLKESSDLNWPLRLKTMQFTKEGNKLLLINDRGIDNVLRYHKETIFWLGRNWYLQFDKPKKGELFVGGNANGNRIYIKEE